MAKVNKFLVCFGVLSGISETKKGKNKNIFGKGLQVCGVVCAFRGGVLPALRCAHLGRALGFRGLSPPFGAFRPFFGAFSLCLFGVACKYALISLFKAV